MTNGLLSLAVLPGVLLMIKVYKLDRIEKEPMQLIVLLLGLGAAVCLPVAILESVLTNITSSMFPPGRMLLIIDNFLCVGLIEELGKYVVTKFTTWNNKEFNYRFDAVVYTITASLGFAILENIMYVFEGGAQVAFMRAILSVPGHAIFGFFMGLYYGAAKVCQVHGDYLGQKRNLRLAIIVPMLLHGFYDFCLSVGSSRATGTFIVFVVILYIVAWDKINKCSREDKPL